MDYKELQKAIVPFLEEEREKLQAAEKTLQGCAPRGEADKKVFLVLKNILKTLEAGEKLKDTGREILENRDYFASDQINEEAKQQSLKTILDRNKYIKNSRLFNIQLIQTYVEEILNDRLHEINIKLEENQRFLHRLLYSSPERGTGPASGRETGQYLFIEIGGEQYGVPFAELTEILRPGGKTARREAGREEIKYKKIAGIFNKNSFKTFQPSKLDKKKVLVNITPKHENTSANYALILNQEGRQYVFFADNLLNLEPVEGQNLGDYVETLDGVYQTIGP